VSSGLLHWVAGLLIPDVLKGHTTSTFKGQRVGADWISGLYWSKWIILDIYDNVRFEVLTVMLLKILVFCDIMLCQLVQLPAYRRSVKPWKCQYLFSSWHTITHQNTWIFTQWWSVLGFDYLCKLTVMNNKGCHTFRSSISSDTKSTQGNKISAAFRCHIRAGKVDIHCKTHHSHHTWKYLETSGYMHSRARYTHF
jgi:hypothetical protein